LYEAYRRGKNMVVAAKRIYKDVREEVNYLEKGLNWSVRYIDSGS